MITRKLRIDLSHFDSDWAKINNNDQDCYILLKTAGLDEVISFQTGLQKIMDDDSTGATEIYKKMMKFVKARFIGGIIYDMDEKKCRAIEKDELDSFDMEILSYIIGMVTGNISKKD